VLTKPADAWQQSTNSSVSCSNNLYCETCWNKSYSYITLGRGIESVKNSLQGQYGRRHINIAAHGSWAVWQASCQHSRTWVMGSMAGVMLTQQHMDHGQSGRHNVNTAAHGPWAVWQGSQHSSTWIIST
jgi:hypothetical protein